MSPTTAQFKALIADDMAKIGKAVKQAGIRID